MQLDSVRKILKSDKYKSASLAEKQNVFDSILSTKEITPQQLSSLIDEDNIERMRREREEERLLELRKINTISYDAFVTAIDDGEISSKDLIMYCRQFKNLNNYCEKTIIKDGNVYPYYVYYRALLRDFGIDLQPKHNAKKLYHTYYHNKANAKLFSGKIINNKFCLTTNFENKITKECSQYSMNDLKEILWNVQIDITVEVLITNDGNIILIELDEIYNEKENKFDYVPNLKNTLELFKSTYQQQVIYRTVLEYEHIHNEIVPLIFDGKLKGLKNSFTAKNLERLKELLLNDVEFKDVEKFDASWEIPKEQLCNFLFTLYKMGIIN